MQSKTGTIAAVNISLEKGTIKEPVEELVIDERGCVGDAHAGVWHRQVSLLATEKINSFGEELKRKIEPGEFAENISTNGLDLGGVAVLDTLSVGDVCLEVTQIGKSCHGDGCSIFREIGKCVMPKEGIFAWVKQGGTMRPGDTIIHQPRPFSCWLIRIRRTVLLNRLMIMMITGNGRPPWKSSGRTDRISPFRLTADFSGSARLGRNSPKEIIA